MNTQHTYERPHDTQLPSSDVAIPYKPIDQLLSYNAVGVGTQPVAMILKLHPTVVMAYFLPQIL